MTKYSQHWYSSLSPLLMTEACHKREREREGAIWSSNGIDSSQKRSFEILISVAHRFSTGIVSIINNNFERWEAKLIVPSPPPLNSTVVIDRGGVFSTTTTTITTICTWTNSNNNKCVPYKCACVCLITSSELKLSHRVLWAIEWSMVSQAVS